MPPSKADDEAQAISELLLAALSAAALRAQLDANEIKAVGIALYGPYLLAVELASMLLLGGLVAAYHLGKHQDP